MDSLHSTSRTLLTCGSTTSPLGWKSSRRPSPARTGAVTSSSLSIVSDKPVGTIPKMRRSALTAAVVALVAWCSWWSAAATAEPAPTPAQGQELRVAQVDAAPAQRIDGFGASGAWWPNDLVKFPRNVQQRVDDMLFSRRGIALSGYRYNIGGGGVGVTNPARAPKEPAADAAGLTFLRAANKAGVPILTGFVNSAPPEFTTNGMSCGGSLKPGSEADYARYLAGVVKRIHDRDHVTLRHVSPMNEPDNSFGACGQEGMQVPVEQRALVVQELGKELARRAPYA